MELFSPENLLTLAMLIALQAVLGFDNLLYISLESKRAPVEARAMVRRVGIGIAVVLRIVLLFVLMRVISLFQDPLFSVRVEGFVESTFNVHALVVLGGGVFIMYTAIKEIWHMMNIEEQTSTQQPGKSTANVIAAIVVMNAIFSIDSILSAMALTDVFLVMATAIVVGGALMIFLADRVADFLQRNRTYEVLGLFVLFVVGIMLLTEGGHLAGLRLFDQPVHAMSKTTFYFVIVVLVLTDLVQTRYQRKLMAQKAALEAVAQ